MFGECRIRPADLWHAKVMLYHCATPQLYSKKEVFTNMYFGKPIIDDSVAGNVQGFKEFQNLAVSPNSLVQIVFNCVYIIPMPYRSTPHSQKLAKF